MKGIILAGGSGTRLYPVTISVCKQLLPVYDKPMIYYPLSSLMLAGINDILVITTPRDRDKFESVLGNGSSLGISITYETQEAPRGIAEAFIIGESFIGNENVCLILGDNIFYGHGLPERFKAAMKSVASVGGGVVFAYYVEDPARYGVIETDAEGRAVSIEEKPDIPKSNYAVTGIYFYDNRVVEIARNLKPSGRGELEITDVNRVYLESGSLKTEKLGRGYAWLDTGTPESLLDASKFIETMEKRQGLKIGCLEEIAYKMGFIKAGQLKRFAERYSKSNYGRYILRVLKESGEKI